MGLVACYHAIAYCDCCGKEIADIGQVETKLEALNILRDGGVLLGSIMPDNSGLSEGVVVCPSCKTEGKGVLEINKREGGDWRTGCAKYRKRKSNAQLQNDGLLPKSHQLLDANWNYSAS